MTAQRLSFDVFDGPPPGPERDALILALLLAAPEPATAAQLATGARFAAQVRRFLRLDRESRLSSAALETLAIIAYQQPVTRAEIETVRGVDSSGVLATLHTRSLIEAVGRLPTVGNPIQYGTTPDFLRHFGLRSLADLPPLGEVDGHDARSALQAAAMAADFEPATTE